jgi:hypothetical protein
MITTRWIRPEDQELIAESLKTDEYHFGNDAEFFYDPNACCNVYEDENGPIMFLRGCIYQGNPELVGIDIQFMSNDDSRRNMEALLLANNVWAAQCKENGFKELVFSTRSLRLKRFCMKYLGFAEVDGRMRKVL